MAKRRRVHQGKGIYCLEGDWSGKKDKTTVEPVLRLLETAQNLRVPYLHKDVATREELQFRLKEWVEPGFGNYPILYLAFHGQPGEVVLGRGKDRFGLSELENTLDGVCKGRIIHFGSCATLDLHGNRLNGFLRRTRALALLGYKSNIDWLSSTAFDLLLLGTLQEISFDVRGMKKLDEILDKAAFSLRKDLEFRMQYNKHHAKFRH